MLDGGLYQFVYITVLIVLTVACALQYNSYQVSRIDSTSKSNALALYILTVVAALFIGLRPLHSAFVDMNNYNASYQIVSDSNNDFVFDIETDNLLFDNVLHFMALNGFDVSLFFLFIAVIYFGAMAWAIRKMFPDDSFYAMIIYLSAFSTFSYGTNGIKAGAAASLFLLAIAYRNRVVISILFALLSWCFHHSMHMVIAAYALTFFIKKPKYYLCFWVVCIFCGMLHANPFADMMVDLSDKKGAQYLMSNDQNWGGKIGFRLDFLIYSAVPVAIGYYVIFMKKIDDIFYRNLFNLYLMCNSLWVLCMYVPFNNRIAYLSWFILPIVSIYPWLRLKIQSNQYKILNTIAFIYLGFTSFMVFFI